MPFQGETMSDEAIRRWERELQRAGLDPIEIAREILRRQPARFWALTTRQISHLSEHCEIRYSSDNTTVGIGNPGQPFVKYRTPIKIIEEFIYFKHIPAIIYDSQNGNTIDGIHVKMDPPLGEFISIEVRCSDPGCLCPLDKTGDCRCRQCGDHAPRNQLCKRCFEASL